MVLADRKAHPQFLANFIHRFRMSNQAEEPSRTPKPQAFNELFDESVASTEPAPFDTIPNQIAVPTTNDVASVATSPVGEAENDPSSPTAV